MKGNQMGILAAYPTQRELQLSNWTWFKRRPASGASAARPTVRIAPAVRRSCKASGEERSIVCALHHATGFLLDDLTFVVSHVLLHLRPRITKSLGPDPSRKVLFGRADAILPAVSRGSRGCVFRDR